MLIKGRETQNITRPVTADELIGTAKELIAARFTRGTLLSCPADMFRVVTQW
jgi:hypothetical protein